MKLLPNYTDYFISPITGAIASFTLLPALTEDYVWEGNSLNRPIPSPVLIDMRLFSSQLKNQVDEIAASTFITQTPNSMYIPNAQPLSLLATGILKSTTSTGVVSTAIPFTDYMGTTLTDGKIWIGNSMNHAVESSYTPVSNLLPFILKTVDFTVTPNAQGLDTLSNGVMINTAGVISTSTSYVQFSGTSAVSGNIAIYSGGSGDFISDSGTSIPNLEALVTDAQQAAAAAATFSELAQNYAESAGLSATDASASAGAAAASVVAAATYASAAAGSASDAASDAAAAFSSKTAAAASATAAASSASSASSSATAAAASALAASKSEAECEQIFLELLGLGIELTGDVSGFNALNNPIVTTLNLTLDAIPLAVSNINANLQKITHLANGTAANDAVNYSQLTGISGTYLQVLNNLSDVNSVSASRTNLGLTNVAIQHVTQHALLVGGASDAITSLSLGTAGQVLQSGGGSADPIYSTATYPSTTTINQILYSSAANTVTGLATANKSVMTTTAAGVPVMTALASDGQLIIGSTSGAPAAATLTAGTGMTITNAGNSITLSVTGGAAVTSVSGTTNRITSTGGTTPVIDISSAYVGQTSLTTLGTITTGTWNGSLIPLAYGGTSVSSVTTAPTATAFAGWDSNKNLSANNCIEGYATTTTVAGTTTLTVSSAYQQYFTGTTTHSVVLPVASTLVLGQSFYIVNNSTGVVTVKSSGANTIQAMASNTTLLVTCILTSGVTSASWASNYILNSPLTLPLSLTNGGTNASLTASNGGIVYSTGSALAILGGTSTANQLLISGASSTPSWTSRYIDYGISGGAQYNLFVGTNCGSPSLTSVTGNTAFGVDALSSIATGSSSQNTAMGTGVFSVLDGGSGGNTAFGYVAGGSENVYTNCTFLGAFADADANNLTNATAIGYGALVAASNCLVLGNGANVGVGITPNAQFQLPTTHANRKLVLYETANNDNQVFGFGTASGIFNFQIDSLTSAYTFNAASSSSASTELMRLVGDGTGNGFLGIGTSTPHAPLQFANTFSTNRKIVIWEDFNNEHQFNGLGQNSSIFRFQVNKSTEDYVFYSAINSTSSTELMRIKGNGKVGIGTSAPDQLLTVNSSTPSKVTSGSWSAFSDSRIKNILGDYEHGLAEIIQIKTRKFKYNDVSGYSDNEKSKIHIGVIAQEIENILPECIVEKVNRGNIPDMRVYDSTPLIYALVNAIKELNQRIQKLEKAA